MTDYHPRELTPRLLEALDRFPVTVVSGLRQAGKSTLLTSDPAFGGRHYRTLDDFAILRAAKANPEALLEQAEQVTFDEVQRAPELLGALKPAVDQKRRPGRFLLSGSANLGLIAGVAETLAGRAIYLALHPMTRREIRRKTETPPVLVRFVTSQSLPSGRADRVEGPEILLGGLPPVCLEKPGGASLWFRGYVQTYVERDVRQLSQITNLVAFQTVVELAALRTGQVLNASTLGRDAKLTGATTARYLHLLEASFLVRRVPPFLNNRSLRLIKSPKMYFTDSGLAAHLAQVSTLDETANDPLMGPLLETWVVQNVTAILEAHLPGARLSYWHEQGRHEVDLVIEHNRKTVAIEIKAATRWTESDLGGLRAFMERTPGCVAGVLAYNGNQAVEIGRKLWAIPIGLLLA
ncbi:MAG: ATP-binding protein [Bryobacteraceae bacterium]